jgi:metal-sulfur cluster biosynthetic enzyme
MGTMKYKEWDYMNEELKENIMGALELVIDPELGVDIVNLGLVYNAEMDETQLLQ